MSQLRGSQAPCSSYNPETDPALFSPSSPSPVAQFSPETFARRLTSLDRRMRNIQLLQASVDAEDDSELRILLDGKHIKYLTVKAGVYNEDDLCFEPALIPMLPPLPGGSWVSGTISRDETSGHPRFTASDDLRLPGVAHTWHRHSIEYLDLSVGKKLRSNVYEAFDPRLNKGVVLKFARFAWEVPQIDAETRAYSWIGGTQIAPEFLGHVAEDGRVIGFVMEHVVGVRHPGLEDLPMCQKVLSQLHGLHIQHGDVNKHNFLVGRDRVRLIDFDQAARCVDESLLTSEMESLGAELQDTSGRGGRLQA